MVTATQQTPMTYGAHAQAIVTLGLPLVGSHLAQFVIGLTDVVMLGWYDVEALAATVLGHSVFFVLFLVGSGFAWAVMPMVASYAGDDDVTQIRRVTRMGLWISALYGAVVMVPLLVGEPLLRALGQAPKTSELGAQYLAIAAFGMIPALAVMVIKSYLSALERANIVLWATLVAAVVNAAVNYILIFGRWGAPELGVRGAAVATISVQIASLLVLVIYIARTLPEHTLFARIWRPDWEAFGRVFRLGWPIGLTNLAEVGLFAASAIMVGWIGTLELAAHGIALNLATATFMVHLGLSNVATIRAGRAFGRRDRAHLVRGGQVVIGMSLCFAALTVVVFLAFGEELVGLFIDPGDPDKAALVAIGAGLLTVAALFQLADGLQVQALGLLRGVQDTNVPMLYAALSYWGIGAPAGYFLGFTAGLGAQGVWLGLVIGLGGAAVSLMWRFWRRSVPAIG